MMTDKKPSEWHTFLRLLLLGIYGFVVFGTFMPVIESGGFKRLLGGAFMYIILGLPWAFFNIDRGNQQMIGADEDSRVLWLLTGGASTLIFAMFPTAVILGIIQWLTDINLFGFIVDIVK